MTSPSDDLKFKVVLLGEGAVGKSSLLLRYVQNKFSPRHLSTVQASFLSKSLEIDGEHVELNIWDTAGQEKYHALGPIYYRGSQGALLIYDITDERSFERVKVWIKELQRALGDSVSLMIVGNKLDLERERVVTKEDGENYAKTVNAEYRETSAKENMGIEQVFDDLCRVMILAHRENSSHRVVESPRRRQIQLIDDPIATKSKCCK